MSSVTAAETYRWTVEEYQRLGETGFFHEDDRVELLNGDIVIMAPIGIRHVKAVRNLNRVMVLQYDGRALVDVQSPVIIDGHSEPQPDILLLHPNAKSRDSLPIPEDVLVLIEVAESSLAYDLKDKRQAYARAGIVEYWLLDLTKSQMYVFRDPTSEGYCSEKIVAADESIAPLAFPDDPIALSELLAP